jgi:hypothetical protein
MDILIATSAYDYSFNAVPTRFDGLKHVKRFHKNTVIVSQSNASDNVVLGEKLIQNDMEGNNCGSI